MQNSCMASDRFRIPPVVTHDEDKATSEGVNQVVSGQAYRSWVLQIGNVSNPLFPRTL